jgi:hypothetical protein
LIPDFDKRRQMMNLRTLLTGLACVALAIWVNGSVSAQDTPPMSPDAPTALQLGTQITYQGQLQRSGAAYTGSCAMEFRLFDAATGGVQAGPTLTSTAVTVNNGIFAVGLDFGNQFTGDARWLQTAVKCGADATFTPLSPRQPQNAVPYAMGLLPGTSIHGANPSANLTVVNTSGAGVAGYSSGSKDNSWGVFGRSANNNGGFFSSDNAQGIVGTSSKHDGVKGTAQDPGRSGVFGENTSTSGTGVYGTANGNGVIGESSKGVGVRGISHAGDRSGVYGYNDTTEPYASGVAGVAPHGNGVFGSSDDHAGGYFVSKNGYGIFAASSSGIGAYIEGKMRSNIVEIAGGSDLAEKFSEANGVISEPGTVMVIDADHPGQIKLSNSAYDRKVVGIVSGAGDVRPGLTLHQEGVMDGNTTMAIAGRVYVKADANAAPIEPGDLLTTSDLPGYAMKASDSSRSHGAVLGKAMTGLASGTGLVLVMVNLQ